MKKILITGANSYIGTSFENHLKNNNEYTIETVDMIDGSWKEKDFSKYDVVFHVAGIAHSDVGNATEETVAKYYKVNTDLPIETAKKAKEDGVKQFIFMSSMIVFGSKNECITKDTLPNPDNFYGNSKLQADIGIHKLEDSNFYVVSLRPPMIYGKGSKGNYPLLSKFAANLLFFPKCKNKRSMLYIENLCEFVKKVIDNNENGYFYPQNAEYTNTSEMVKKIAIVKNHKIFMVPGMNGIIHLLMHIPGKIGTLAKKALGDSYYDMQLSEYFGGDYQIKSLDESIRLTEEKN